MMQRLQRPITFAERLLYAAGSLAAIILLAIR